MKSYVADLLPASLRINGHRWRITVLGAERIDALSVELGLALEGETTYGICVGGRSRRIYLRREQSLTELTDTLTHEVGHAIEIESGIRVRHEFIEALGAMAGPMIVRSFLNRRRPCSCSQSRSPAAAPKTRRRR